MDIERLTQAIQDSFPEIEIRAATPMLDGWDSVVLDINGEYIFRFPRRADVEAQLDKEIALLPELAKTLPLDVPRFEFFGQGRPEGRRFVGYRKIKGVPLEAEGVHSGRRSQIVRQLARFLTALHGFPVEKAVRLGVRGGAVEWKQHHERFYAWARENVAPLLDAPTRAAAAAAWENVLRDEASFRFQPALVHRDLGNEHILYDGERGTIAGIIDWGDATIGDPAIDFAGLLYSFGSGFTQEVLSLYGGKVDPAFWRRIVFYVNVSPYYEIHYGKLIEDEGRVKAGLEKLKSELGQSG